MTSLPGFTLPAIFDNPRGWGPSDEQPSGSFSGIPYIPFSKGDKVTRVANWISPADSRDTRDTRTNRRTRDGPPQAYGSSLAAQFAYAADEDEESFSLVDVRAPTQRRIGVRAVAGHANRGRGGAARGGMQRLGQQGRGGFRRRFGWRDNAAAQRSASVVATDEWHEVQEIQFSRMRDLSFDAGEPVEMGTYGSPGQWDNALDRLTARMEKPLTAPANPRFNVTASDDPVLADAARDPRVRVLATDSVLAALMAAMASNSAWDVVVNRQGNQMFLDKRDGGPLDYAAVNENAVPPPASAEGDINGAEMLAQEARQATRRMLAQAAPKNAQAERPNPFGEDDTAAYRYRSFDLATADSEEPCLLAVRADLDAVTAGNPRRSLFVRALTQHDISVSGAGGALDWRMRLDAQRGAVMATEMMNNAGKMARWAFQAMVAGADLVKIGYIIRTYPRDNSRHSLLGFQTYRPAELLANMGLSEYNAWGIVKALVDLCLQLEEGRYVVMRDPNNPLIRIYAVPPNTFDDASAPAENDADGDEPAN
ncbi:hypothetical protein GGI15_000012 [Coemansia interrupta]|uniref:Eukaryotic translation initiation factor 3 subunit D n=1 Tax=Coemansia interrupta TaxID=1126814 RepID=A0A9W8HMM7_9FUNG|nr:hypothetical protein GGI15_000012 [Coemansia interrupta]